MGQNIQFVFLDRDGVINEKAPEGDYICHQDQFRLLPGAPEAIAKLNQTGRKVLLVTNQRGIALGRYSQEDLANIHAHLQTELARRGAHLDAIYICPHDKGECDCRKPGTGLFLQAFRDFPEAVAANSLMIGDSLSDIEAARKLGMRAFFIRGKEQTQKSGSGLAEQLADAVFDSISDAVLSLD